MQLLAFLVARAREPSSYAGLAMLLTAAGIHYSDAQVNAVVNLLMAAAGVVAVFIPEGKAPGRGIGRVFVPFLLCAGLASLASACSSTTVAAGAANATTTVGTAVANANADIAALQPVFATLCAGGAWADAQFQAVASVARINPGVAADEAKAIAALKTLCSAPPTNIASALATVTTLYKQITTATPVIATTTVAPAPASSAPAVVTPASGTTP